ncbi:head-tail connector protein [Brucella abortus]
MAQYPDASTFCGIEVDFIAGFGESGVEVPDTLKQAILTLTAHLYESRAGVNADAVQRSFPPIVNQMVDSWRRISL